MFILGKVPEQIVREHTCEYLEQNIIVIKNQYGLAKNKLCQTRHICVCMSVYILQ